MAYSAVTLAEVVVRGQRHIRASFSGASISGVTEVAISGLPPFGRIVRVLSDLTAGSGATVNPILGNATAPSNNTELWSAAAAADPFDEQPTSPVPYYSSTGTLYYRDRVNAGADNATSVEVYLLDGWG